jgi:hypothetical protein
MSFVTMVPRGFHYMFNCIEEDRSFNFQTQLALEIQSFYTINMARHKNQDE